MRLLPKQLALSLVSLTLALLGAEHLLRWRELQEQDARLPQELLVGRLSPDSLKGNFFNGCLIEQDIVQEHPTLGFINLPDVDGYSIHLDTRNLVIRRRPSAAELAQWKQPVVASFHVNNLGNRGPDMAAAKPSDVARIVFVGDSVTFGYYVEEAETFVSRVQGALAVRPPRRLECVNAGVTSLDARDVLAHVRDRASGWSPDLVVWGFYVNDVLERESDVLFPVRRPGMLAALRKTATGRLFGQWLMTVPAMARFEIADDEPANRAVESGWRRAEAALAEAQALLGERKVPLAVVALPSGVQLGRSWTRPQYQARLKRICERLGIRYIDPLPALEAAGTLDELYYAGDAIHPNPKGHAAIAGAIVQVLSGML